MHVDEVLQKPFPVSWKVGFRRHYQVCWDYRRILLHRHPLPRPRRVPQRVTVEENLVEFQTYFGRETYQLIYGSRLLIFRNVRKTFWPGFIFYSQIMVCALIFSSMCRGIAQLFPGTEDDAADHSVLWCWGIYTVPLLFQEIRVLDRFVGYGVGWIQDFFFLLAFAQLFWAACR